MKQKFEYKNGELVNYDIKGSVKGKGYIRGVVGTGSAVIGVTYIIEDTSNFPNETYPYPCFPCFECMLSR